MAELLLIDLHLPDLLDEGGLSVCAVEVVSVPRHPRRAASSFLLWRCSSPRVYLAPKPVSCCSWYSVIKQRYVTEEIGI